MLNLVKHECCINILISCRCSLIPSLHILKELMSDIGFEVLNLRFALKQKEGNAESQSYDINVLWYVSPSMLAN